MPGRVDRNSRPHWALYALVRYESENESEKVKTRELDMFARPTFKNHLSSLLGSLTERDVVNRESFDGHHYLYWISDEGKAVLYNLGKPTEYWDNRELDVDLPDLPPWESQDSEIEPDEVEMEEDPGPFRSAKARRRFFAGQYRHDYPEWTEDQREETQHEGEVEFEGVEDAMEQEFNDEATTPEVGRQDVAKIEAGKTVKEPLGHIEPRWGEFAVAFANRGLLGLTTMALNKDLPGSIVLWDSERIVDHIPKQHDFTLDELLDMYEITDQDGNELDTEDIKEHIEGGFTPKT